MAIKRGIRRAAVYVKRKVGRKVRRKVKTGARSVGKEVRKPWSTAQVAGVIAGGAAVGEMQRRRTGRKKLAQGRRQGLIVGAHLTKKSRKKVRTTYRKARKAGHRF